MLNSTSIASRINLAMGNRRAADKTTVEGWTKQKISAACAFQTILPHHACDAIKHNLTTLVSVPSTNTSKQAKWYISNYCWRFWLSWCQQPPHKPYKPRAIDSIAKSPPTAKPFTVSLLWNESICASILILVYIRERNHFVWKRSFIW